MKRNLITIGVVGLAVLIVVAMARRPRSEPILDERPPTTQAQVTPATAPATAPSTTAPTSGGATATTNPAEAPPTTAPAPTTAPVGLHAKVIANPRQVSLGNQAEGSPYSMRVDLVHWGSAVGRVQLAGYYESILPEEPGKERRHYVLVTPVTVDSSILYPFAARALTINGERLDLLATEMRGQPIWDLVSHDDSHAQYVLTVLDSQDRPVVEFVRRFTLAPSSYELRCEQLLRNLSGAPLSVVWEQNAQGDPPIDADAYLGDRRMLVTGYFNPDYNPTRQFIYTDSAHLTRTAVLTESDSQLTQIAATWNTTPQAIYNLPRPATPLWPNPKVAPRAELVWIASLNRYFTVAVFEPIAQGKNPTAMQSRFPNLQMQVLGKHDSGKPGTDGLMLILASQTLEVPAGGSARLDLSLFAGPRKSELFAEHPYAALQFTKLIRYELGCTLCTFQPLAQGLLWFLRVLHAGLFDWGMAIIVLVLVVRLILHPITKKSQVNMMKMGKQMAALQPEIQKLKKKYADEPQKFQQEQLKLWREKGVNPANMLGCLPMFLQMPIWVALYAMLYYAIELRHQPAFYGFFQLINERWQFLADLSSADRFITFSNQPLVLNLYFVHLDYSAINIIPVLMGVVFYFQQKLTTPPAATPEQAQQQKIMQYMTLLFPVLLYSAPSGLTLYILASTAAGIVDSYIVRKHVRDQEAAGTLFTPKPRKAGGFMDRITKAMEERQAMMAKRHQERKKKER